MGKENILLRKLPNSITKTGQTSKDFRLICYWILGKVIYYQNSREFQENFATLVITYYLALMVKIASQNIFVLALKEPLSLIN